MVALLQTEWCSLKRKGSFRCYHSSCQERSTRSEQRKIIALNDSELHKLEGREEKNWDRKQKKTRQTTYQMGSSTLFVVTALNGSTNYSFTERESLLEVTQRMH